MLTRGFKHQVTEVNNAQEYYRLSKEDINGMTLFIVVVWSKSPYFSNMIESDDFAAYKV